MLNIFTFDAFSFCHSLGQSVTGIKMFIFWLIPEEYGIQRKFVYTTENMSRFMNVFIITDFELNVVFINRKCTYIHYT